MMNEKYVKGYIPHATQDARFLRRGKRRKGSIAGFSLLELMLVIVIVASMVLYGANLLKGKSNTGAEAKTALEMQTLLEVLTKYAQANLFVPYGSAPNASIWPSSLAYLITNFYLPDFATCSSWQGLSIAGEASCNGKAGYQLVFPSGTTYQNALYVGIALTLPDENTALNIGRLLPTAVVTNNTVSAYIPIPASRVDDETFAGYKGWISGGGIVNLSSDTINVTLPACPSPYEAHYMQFIEYETTGHNPTGLGDLFFTDFDFTADGSGNNNPVVNSQGLYATYTNYNVTQQSGFSAFNFYVTFCVPPNHWFVNTGGWGCSASGGDCASPGGDYQCGNASAGWPNGCTSQNSSS